MSLGATIDLSTGDGAGIKATFDRVTYAATQAGAVVIAAAGNNGYNLSNPRYVEIPAQSRGVLAIAASTNPDCMEDTRTGAVCVPGPPPLAYYSTTERPSMRSPRPAEATPQGPTWPSAGGFAEPAPPAFPTRPMACPPTPDTASAVSTSDTLPMSRPSEPAPRLRSSQAPPHSCEPRILTGTPQRPSTFCAPPPPHPRPPLPIPEIDTADALKQP